jgi:hypothetical protein
VRLGGTPRWASEGLAGFAEPEKEEIPFRLPFAERDAYYLRYLSETSASSPSRVLRSLRPEEQAKVREQEHEVARPYRALVRDTTSRADPTYFPPRCASRASLLCDDSHGRRAARFEAGSKYDFWFCPSSRGPT